MTHAFTRAVSETRSRISPTASTYPATPASPATIRTRVTGDRRRSTSPAACPIFATARIPRRTRYRNHDGHEANWTRGRHNYTFGGQIRVNTLDLISQENGRGSFLFTGGAHRITARRLPARSAAIELARVRQRRPGFHAWSYAAYVHGRPAAASQPDPQPRAALGVRGAAGRSARSDGQSRRRARLPRGRVRCWRPIRSVRLTGRVPATLVQRDILGFQPRLSMAWRPILGSSLLVRAGYDRTRSSGVAQTLARLMAQQPPLVTTGNAVTSPEEAADAVRRLRRVT